MVFTCSFCVFGPLHRQPLQVYSPPIENVCFLNNISRLPTTIYKWDAISILAVSIASALVFLGQQTNAISYLCSHPHLAAAVVPKEYSPRKCDLRAGLLISWVIISQKESYTDCDLVLIAVPHHTSRQPICSFHFLCDHILVFIPPSLHSDSFHQLCSFMRGTGMMLWMTKTNTLMSSTAAMSIAGPFNSMIQQCL